MKEKLRVVIAGEVDHGKSTILGRLLYDTGSLPDGKIEEIKKSCERRSAEMEWSFLLDAFQAERDQAITIDTTQVNFSSEKRDYVMIDAPGHVQFLKNMMSGAGEAHAAILVIDAAEGLREQTTRHARLLALLGIEQVAVVISKMDAVNYSHSVFSRVSREIRGFLKTIDIRPVCILPLAARNGEMIVGRGGNMNWYKSRTLVEALDHFTLPETADDKPLRFVVQDVYRFEGKRIIAGRVESGVLKTGDELHFSPYSQQAHVESIEIWPADPQKTRAQAGEVIGITLDERIFVERGHIAAHESGLPMLSPVFRADIFWLEDRPPVQGDILRARFGLYDAVVSVQAVKEPFQKNMTGEMTLRARGMLPVDAGAKIVLENEEGIVAAGTMNMEGYPDCRREFVPKSGNIRKVDHLLNAGMRAQANGHHGGVFWLTGLPGSGKSTLAMALERALFDRGMQVYVLDGDNIRHGLNADLGFSPQERAENIRRGGHIAALMADAGMIVITAFISPYRSDRERVKEAATGCFSEIYISADLATCEARDPKGLYKKARAGKITGFTGIDSPYETPESPDLTVDTQNNSVEQCVRQVLDFIESRTSLSPQAARPDKRKEKIFVVQ